MEYRLYFHTNADIAKQNENKTEHNSKAGVLQSVESLVKSLFGMDTRDSEMFR